MFRERTGSLGFWETRPPEVRKYYSHMDRLRRFYPIPEGSGEDSVSGVVKKTMDNVELNGMNSPTVLVVDGQPTAGKSHLINNDLTPLIRVVSGRMEKKRKGSINLIECHWDKIEDEVGGLARIAKKIINHGKAEMDDRFIEGATEIANERGQSLPETLKFLAGIEPVSRKLYAVEFLATVGRIIARRTEQGISEKKPNTLIIVHKPGGENPTSDSARPYGTKDLIDLFSKYNRDYFVGYIGLVANPSMYARIKLRHLLLEAKRKGIPREEIEAITRGRMISYDEEGGSLEQIEAMLTLFASDGITIESDFEVPPALQMLWKACLIVQDRQENSPTLSSMLESTDFLIRVINEYKNEFGSMNKDSWEQAEITNENVIKIMEFFAKSLIVAKVLEKTAKLINPNSYVIARSNVKLGSKQKGVIKDEIAGFFGLLSNYKDIEEAQG